MLQFCKALPKVELHLHLDGSLPAHFIRSRCFERDIYLPEEKQGDDMYYGPSAIREYLHCMKTGQVQDQGSGGNWQVFDFCNKLLQTSEELSEASKLIGEYYRDAENGKHLELRFCPALHTLEGLSCRQAVEAVQHGLLKVNGLSSGVIVCGLRSHPPKSTLEMAQLACDMQEHGVIAFDIAGDENSFPLSDHQDAIALCKKHHLPVSVHAGETGMPGNYENLKLAIDEMQVDRVGHGWALIRAPHLLPTAVRNGTILEVCVTSNIRPNRIPSFAEHPIRELFQKGVAVTSNSDNWMLSGTNELIACPSGELFNLWKHLGFSRQEIAQCVSNSARGAFLRAAHADGDFVNRFVASVEDCV
eukprot:CAMPEP_0203791294 /NCGR_PEP_ID=MMETSP0100_2-20121128/4546_1 /ASSEMBLY_ACC=CAM_ASM_000210 /TAXON_ID=96639 /ORGANISM=" , Strain NY0313808BC1" /LENGTH=359 /DNA_ID=CAMNT_0050694579 /DNA_START=308 /DNA_END=1387 /DNA_ORIENTATION=+